MSDPEVIYESYGNKLIGAGAAGGGGGHSIIDSDGETMTQEDAMQFLDAHLTDDSVNGRTVVENVKEVTLAGLSQATERGMYLATDEESVPIGEIEEDSVSVTASSDTWASLIVKLQSQPNYDYDKITRDSILQVGNEFYRCIGKSSGSADFTLVRGYSTTSIATLYIQNGIGYRYDWANSGSGTNNSSASVTDGTKLTLYYGTSSTVINLKTSADYCMMKTGVEMSVDSALGRMRFYSTGISNGGSITLNFEATDRFVIYLTHSSTAGRTYVGIGCGGTNPHLDDIFPNANITKATGSKTITLTNNTGGTLSGWVEIQQTGAFSIT